MEIYEKNFYRNFLSGDCYVSDCDNVSGEMRLDRSSHTLKMIRKKDNKLRYLSINLLNYFEDPKTPILEEFVMFELEHQMNIRWFLHKAYHPTLFERIMMKLERWRRDDSL